MASVTDDPQDTSPHNITPFPSCRQVAASVFHASEEPTAALPGVAHGLRAAVIGGGIAGIVTARVLAPHYADVVLMDKESEDVLAAERASVIS